MPYKNVGARAGERGLYKGDMRQKLFLCILIVFKSRGKSVTYSKKEKNNGQGVMNNSRKYINRQKDSLSAILALFSFKMTSV